jgi:hypothetical protein
MKIIVATGIIAGKPTANGNIYSHKLLMDLISKYNRTNKYSPKSGSLINRQHIQQVGDITHTCGRIFMNESSMLCAEINISDTPAGKAILDAISSGSEVVGRPITSLPASAMSQKTGSEPFIVPHIDRIIRVQLEIKENTTGLKEKPPENTT